MQLHLRSSSTSILRRPMLPPIRHHQVGMHFLSFSSYHLRTFSSLLLPTFLFQWDSPCQCNLACLSFQDCCDDFVEVVRCQSCFSCLRWFLSFFKTKKIIIDARALRLAWFPLYFLQCDPPPLESPPPPPPAPMVGEEPFFAPAMMPPPVIISEIGGE